jgi:hypothetical protein
VAADRAVIGEPEDLVRGFHEAMDEMIREIPADPATSKSIPV